MISKLLLTLLVTFTQVCLLNTNTQAQDNLQEPDFSLVGYASLNGSTTGGAGGTEYYVSDYVDSEYDEPGEYLYQILRSYRYERNWDKPIIIYIDHPIRENEFGRSKLDITDNKNVSIIGVDDLGEFEGVGWTVRRSSNVIFRNLTIHHVAQGEGTGIELTDDSHNIWIDRNTFYSKGPDETDDKDYYDGLVDIKRNVEYVTVSWNVFRNSWKASLLGHDDNASLAANHITYHHNLYENINSRTPLVRFATVHTFNNYYKDIHSSAINCRMGAQVRVENNYFENVGSGEPHSSTDYIQGPVGWWYGSDIGYWDVIGNIVIDSPTDHIESTTSTTVPYSYEHVLHSAEDVPSIVLEYAGASGVGDSPDDPEDPVVTYSIDVNVSGNGTVSKSPNANFYSEGDEVELTANAGFNWEFQGWSGDLSINDNPVVLTISEDVNIQANFDYVGEVVEGDDYIKQPLTSADLDERDFYMIVNRSNGKAMDIEARSVENKANIVVTDIQDVACQLWRVEDEGGGYYNLVNGHTDKVVRDEGPNVEQDRDGSSGYHHWSIELVEDGYFRFINDNNSDHALSVDGDNVVTSALNSSHNQQWQIMRVTAHSSEPDFSIQGFATVGEGTTGGEGGETVTVSTEEDLLYYMQHEDPYIILIDGVIELGEGDHHRPEHRMHSIAPNKTLFGLDGAEIRGGGFNIRGTRNDGQGEVTRSNIIIRNLTFDGGAPDDFINIEWGATHIWIDHNTFNGPGDDGIIDIKREASYITVSWNVIKDHHKTMLLGHDESHTHDRGFLKVTYHHNFIYNSESRHPRMRFGQAHLFNNYFEDIGSYVMGPGREAQIISENNHVWISGRYTDWYDESGIVLERGQGSLINRINHDHDPRIVTGTPDWAPEDYYLYTLNPAISVREMVTQNAGAGVLSAEDAYTTSVTQKPLDFNVSIGPNPISDNLIINIENPTDEYIGSSVTLTVYDMRGRAYNNKSFVINSVNDIKKSLSVDNLATGICFLLLEVEGYKAEKVIFTKIK